MGLDLHDEGSHGAAAVDESVIMIVFVAVVMRGIGGVVVVE